jgi:hypothetical protein
MIINKIYKIHIEYLYLSNHKINNNYSNLYPLINNKI